MSLKMASPVLIRTTARRLPFLFQYHQQALNLDLRKGIKIRTLITTTTATKAAAAASPPRPTTAAEAADQLLTHFSHRTIKTTDTIDATQLAKLIAILGRHSPQDSVSSSSSSSSSSFLSHTLINTPAPGSPLPPGYHLNYHLPIQPESLLGPDGTDTTFNAPAPFTRRMWAGGRMRWTTTTTNPTDTSSTTAPAPLLRVGDIVEEHTRLIKAVPKRSGKDGQEMVLVEVEKSYFPPSGQLALVDQRSWIFRRGVDANADADADAGVNKKLALSRMIKGEDQETIASIKPSTIEDITTTTNPTTIRRLSWSPLALFRFSALTFNGHMIHYNNPWARAVEGHRGLVVHGPLNLICMLDYWRDVHSSGGGGKDQAQQQQGLDQRQQPNNRKMELLEISYRAMSPLYAGEEYEIRTEGIQSVAPTAGSPSRTTSGDKNHDVGEKHEGEQVIYDIVVVQGERVCMKGTITARSV